jgi:hypothetical protein
LHGTELCVAAAGVLIARPAGDPGVQLHPPVARDVRLDPRPLPVPAPRPLTAAARAPPTL